MYDIEFTNITNNEKVILNISHDCSELQPEIYGFNKKIKTSNKNKLKIDEILKLTIKSYSNLSNIVIHYYLKFRIPKKLRRFFKKVSQNPE